MRYLTCPPKSEREVTPTNVLGEPIKKQIQDVNGKATLEVVTVSWWDFIILAAADEKFYEKLEGNQLEAIEVGVAFRTTINEARKQELDVVLLEDDIAKRLKATILARNFDRNVQHSYLAWIKLVNGISDKDPRVAAADAMMKEN